jgi:hypothetical protein
VVVFGKGLTDLESFHSSAARIIPRSVGIVGRTGSLCVSSVSSVSSALV